MHAPTWLARSLLLPPLLSGLAVAQRHPLYDDKGTLAWSTTFSAAKEAAKKADKLIFVEVGTKT